DTQAEYKVTTTAKVEKAIVVENEEIAVEEDIEIKEEIIETIQAEIEEIVKKDINNNTVEPTFNEVQEPVEEIAVESESSKNEELKSTQSDGRVGRLNTAPLMKKKLGKSR
ncbi:hypothetical protein, partial [Clostridium sp.]|uniref:hypothetical protein n=1 Tax=Clostridium sp. TaxID=1506 RepID=UPI003F3F1CC5